ncbi:hypothetical protein MKW92_003387 [Papaver armeniacum]|nr:hypothetical protein MKW92_003387 [Papaver armeniacum]
MAPLRDLMSIMTEFPEYSLVFALYNAEGAERHCAINETHYRESEKCFDNRWKELFRTNHKVFYLEVVSLSDYDEVFFEVTIS